MQNGIAGRNRIIGCAAALAAAAILIMILQYRPGTAGADSSAGVSSGTQALLDRMEPGATVTTQPDGSVAVYGRETPESIAESQRMDELQEAGPNTIRCAGDGIYRCVAVPNDEVRSALRDGDKHLYGRMVHGFITKEVTDRGSPIFAAGDLVCGPATSTGVFTCGTVKDAPPVLADGQTTFVVYQRWDVSFDTNGLGRIHTPLPAIAARRAS